MGGRGSSLSSLLDYVHSKFYFLLSSFIFNFSTFFAISDRKMEGSGGGLMFFSISGERGRDRESYSNFNSNKV